MGRIIGALLAVILCFGAVSMVSAQKPVLSEQKVAMPETPAQRAERLKWWREARFGMFIHWGPVSQKGTEISWSRGAIPIEEYDSLYKTFNPTKFNAKEWVAIAKAAGMKYMVFVAKHWDGFCMWPTKTTDYNIGSSPFERDICGELAREAQKAGIRIGWYFCPPDMHDPDCKTERNEEFLKRMRGQLTELLTDYGPISMLWFDFAAPPEGSPWDQENTYRLVRKLQPKIIIDNRLDMNTMADYHAMIMSPNADYYTPEQRVGGYDDKTPWETCMTIGDQWSYKPNDNVKSTSDCLQNLIRCAGGDGNLLFNVGPMPTGEIEARQVDRLKEMGQWLAKYGESIYGTRGGPFKPGDAIACTRKGNAIYVHVLRQSVSSLELPAIPRKIKSATLLTGGKVSFTQSSEGIKIEIPSEYCREIDTIVKLTLDGSALTIAAVETPRPWTKLANGMRVRASNVYQNNAGLGPDMAFDGDKNTRWATDTGITQAWLTVEYEKPTKVNSVVMSEGWDRVRAYELQYHDGSDWKTFYKGTTIGDDFHASFEPVTAKVFRLMISQSIDGPTFWGFELK